MKTEVIIRATRPRDILGAEGRKIRELAAVRSGKGGGGTAPTREAHGCPGCLTAVVQVVQKRFGLKENSVTLYAERVANRGLCAMAQADNLKFKLLQGLALWIFSSGC